MKQNSLVTCSVSFPSDGEYACAYIYKVKYTLKDIIALALVQLLFSLRNSTHFILTSERCKTTIHS